MAKYNWTIDTLMSRLKKLEDLALKTQEREKLELIYRDIYFLKHYIEDYLDNSNLQKLAILEGFNLTKEILEDIPFVWHDIKEFRDITTFPIVVAPDPKRCSLSKKDILDITHDFYKSLNRYFFGNFMKNFYRRNDHIVFNHSENSPYRGENIYIHTTNESFIEIIRNYTLQDVFTSIHEYSHATSSCINPKHLTHPKELFTEIDTIFMELIATDFLENLIKNGEATLIRASEHNEMICIADDLATIIELTEFERLQADKFTTNKEIKLAAKEHCNLPSEIVEDIFTNPNMNTEQYLISYMFALELYKVYLEDKEKHYLY